jgi:hypothetical protein
MMILCLIYKCDLNDVTLHNEFLERKRFLAKPAVSLFLNGYVAGILNFRMWVISMLGIYLSNPNPNLKPDPNL